MRLAWDGTGRDAFPNEAWRISVILLHRELHLADGPCRRKASEVVF